MNRTVGISPKVSIPALALAGAGLLLVVGGVVVGDETLRTLGYGALGSALAGGFVGATAPAGVVVDATPVPAANIGPDSDALLPPEAQAKIGD